MTDTLSIAFDGERPAPGRRCRAPQDPRRLPPRGPRAHRHAPRLRARRVRRVHRPARRRAGALVPDARGAGRGASDHDDRGPRRRRRRHEPAAGGAPRRATRSSAASARPGFVMQITALLAREPDADRGRDPRGAVGQPLPLHRLRDDHRRRACAAAGSRSRRDDRHVLPAQRFVGVERPALGGSAHPHRRRPLRRRRPAARHAPRRVRAQPVAHATHHQRRRQRGARAARASSRSTPAPTSRRCSPPATAAHDVPRAAGVAVHASSPTDKVRLVGDPIALVVAESRYVAEDARRAGRGRLRRSATGRLVGRCARPEQHADLRGRGRATSSSNGRTSSYGDVDARVREGRPRRRARRIDQHRHQNVPMECRGSVAELRPRHRACSTVHGSNQGVHLAKMIALSGSSASTPDKVRVLCGDIGGSFGLKIGTSREDLAVRRRVTRPRPPGEVDRGPPRAPDGLGPGARGEHDRRGRGDRTRATCSA